MYLASFCENNSDLNLFLKNIVNDVIEHCQFNSLNNDPVQFTISYATLIENKIRDNFNFEANEFTAIRLNEQNEETNIANIKEVTITAQAQLEFIFK